MSPARYLCVHGHFYQPPRENPWLETIEQQDSAYPHHDWNERITAECYAPNTAARILDGAGRIVHIVNNYARMSFNVGPTLLAWLQTHEPETYAGILAADAESRARFEGHGSAMAQAYNHAILPLCNRRDKVTQVVWGIRDFVHRFGRPPEGMWLPETAVDVETLEVLAEQGIAFTVLAPRQARRVRPLGGNAGAWRDTPGERVDPSTAYRAALPSGRSIAIFFYDGPVSRAVAFERLLDDGARFLQRLVSTIDPRRTWPQLVHIATDGETYGHHHRYGDMALGWALQHVESDPSIELTNYSRFLARHPPAHEVEIAENTSWSCAHGVERWRGDCGCNSSARAGWRQAWRAPLRDALDWLRDELAPLYEAAAGALLRDPWAARDDYLSVVLDRSRPNVERFLARHTARPMGEAEQVTALRLLESQRCAMLMYTSCGWFFDELSGIETLQVMQYAGRAMQLAELVSERRLEEAFLERLARAPSNVPERGDGRRIYDELVRPRTLDLLSVGAHYAVSAALDGDGERTRVYCYDVQPRDLQILRAGRAKLAMGRVSIASRLTLATDAQAFAVLHLGDHTVSGGVRADGGEAPYARMAKDLTEAFGRADFADTLRLIGKHLPGPTYSLRSIFHDEQRRFVEELLATTVRGIDDEIRELYELHTPLMRFLGALAVPLPISMRATAEVVLNEDLMSAVAAPELDAAAVEALLREARAREVRLDAAGLTYALEANLGKLVALLLASPGDLPLLRRLEGAARLARTPPFDADLWRVQNAWWALAQTPRIAEDRRTVAGGDAAAREWADAFAQLGKSLGMKT